MRKRSSLGIVLACALAVMAQSSNDADGHSPTATVAVHQAEVMLEQARRLDGTASIALLKQIVGLQLPAEGWAETVKAEAYRLLGDAFADDPLFQLALYRRALHHATSPELELPLRELIADIESGTAALDFRRVAGTSTPTAMVDDGLDDHCGDADPIALDHSEITHINPLGEHDWREFTLTERTRVSIETRKADPTPGDDTELALYADCVGTVPDGQVAFDDDGGDVWLSKLELCLRPGTYYLEVGAFLDSRIVTNFELAVEATESPCLDVPDPSAVNMIFTPEEDHAIPAPPSTLQRESVYNIAFGEGIFEYIPGLVPFTSGVDALHVPDLMDGFTQIAICTLCECPEEDLECDCPCEVQQPPVLFSVNPSVFVVNDGQQKHLFEGGVYRYDDGVINPDPGWAALGLPNATLDALAMDWSGRYYFSTDKRERIVYNGRRKTLFPGSVYYRVSNGGGRIRRYFDGSTLGIADIDAFHLFPGGDIAFSTADVEYYSGPNGVEQLFPEHVYICDPEDCAPEIYLDAVDWNSENLNGFSLEEMTSEPPCEPSVPDDEICDGRDNDCDGEVDEGGDALCDNGNFCDGTETCGGVDLCQPGIPPACTAELWMSFRSDTAVPGVGTVRDEDIVIYDTSSGLWSMILDGSDVGLSSLEISGLAVLPGGDLLLSFTEAGTVGGLSIDDSDVVRFSPTSLGSTTAGTFSFYFDGSDVGLTTNGEDLDAVALAADGSLIVSTRGAIDAVGASGADEDLWTFTATSLGSSTSGSFSHLFDGSDVGLNDSSGEDVDAATINVAGELLLSTEGSFAVSGASGDDEDVVLFTPTGLGSSTSGSFAGFLDLSTLGIAAGEDIGAMHVVD